MNLNPEPRRSRASVAERLKTHSVVSADGCWLWRRALDKDGYGRVWVAGKVVPAHRAAYETFVGQIPADLVVDHLCHTRDESCTGVGGCPHRRCVNPAHLELVTKTENMRRSRNLWAINARKTHCKNGHEFTPANTYVWKGERSCRICSRAASARYQARKAGAR